MPIQMLKLYIKWPFWGLKKAKFSRCGPTMVGRTELRGARRAQPLAAERRSAPLCILPDFCTYSTFVILLESGSSKLHRTGVTNSTQKRGGCPSLVQTENRNDGEEAGEPRRRVTAAGSESTRQAGDRPMQVRCSFSAGAGHSYRRRLIPAQRRDQLSGASWCGTVMERNLESM